MQVPHPITMGASAHCGTFLVATCLGRGGDNKGLAKTHPEAGGASDVRRSSFRATIKPRNSFAPARYRSSLVIACCTAAGLRLVWQCAQTPQ